jgi:hypothetical protein
MDALEITVATVVSIISLIGFLLLSSRSRTVGRESNVFPLVIEYPLAERFFSIDKNQPVWLIPSDEVEAFLRQNKLHKEWSNMDMYALEVREKSGYYPLDIEIFLESVENSLPVGHTPSTSSVPSP